LTDVNYDIEGHDEAKLPLHEVHTSLHLPPLIRKRSAKFRLPPNSRYALSGKHLRNGL